MIRLILLAMVSAIPLAAVRAALYRLCFGFRIAKTARVGMFNLLDVRELVLAEHAEIRGFGNVFLSMHRVELDEYARIGASRVGLNLFRGTANKCDRSPAALRLGKCALIELFHYFDVCADITLGDNTVIGGIRSVFFTHTLHKEAFDPITLGRDVYVGSNSLFQMGVTVADGCVVGMGSVVIQSLATPGALCGGVPARVVRPQSGFDMEAAMKLRRRPYAKGGHVVNGG